jgi:peroxiredoxin
VGATAIVFVLAFLFTLALRPSATPPPTPTVEPTFVVTPLVLQLAPTYTLPPQIPDMPRATFVPQPSKTAIPAPNPTATPPPIGLSVGATAPDFRLKDLFGVEQQLAAQRGKLVAINFWATWCNPCREEIPALQRAYELHKNRGFLVWGVNAGESTAQAQRFVGEIQVNFPLLLDGDSRTTRLYRVFALPSTFFVDRNGVIQQVVVGAMDERTLESHLKRLLN